MRVTLFVLAILCVAADAPKGSPEEEAVRVRGHLINLPVEDRGYAWFWSFNTVPEEHREKFPAFLRYWLRNLTTNPNRRYEPVPLDGDMWLLDLRRLNWNGAARRVVAEREPRHRQPWIPNDVANEIRPLIGEKNDTDHVIAVVDAWWLFRETYETVVTPSYYDLIFAKQRFPGSYYWPGGKDRDGHEFAQGWYGGKDHKFVDFPATLDEWLTAFVADDVVKAIDDEADKIRIRNGAVAQGSLESRQGSRVARHNREIWITPVPTGLYSQTFDQAKSDGENNLTGNEFTDEKNDQGKVIADGGEALISTPAGDALASLLFDAKGNRVDTADPGLVVNTSDELDRRVNGGPGCCMLCHMPEYGWLSIRNKVEIDYQRGIKPTFLDEHKKEVVESKDNYEAFFLDWQEKFEFHRSGIKKSVNASGFDGPEYSNLLLSYKHRYDAPLTVEDMERETGFPFEVIKLAAAKTVNKQIAAIAKGDEVPRQIWDVDAFPAIMTAIYAKSVLLEVPKDE